VLILVVGPSGAGKDTLMDGARAALADDPRFRFVRREITRPAGAGGEDHIAVTESDFAARVAAGGYALHWRAHGLGYGIPADIATDLAGRHVVVANVSRSVIAETTQRFPVLMLEITAPSAVLAARLAARGREDAADIAERLRRDVALPADVAVERVVNDASVAEGVARVVAALSRAAESVRRW
jgi:ribose 1,5-bisphosphokinase